MGFAVSVDGGLVGETGGVEQAARKIVTSKTLISVDIFFCSMNYLSNFGLVLPPLFECHCKCAASSRCADHIQVALVLFDDLAGDRETESNAAEEMVSASLNVIEAVEDARQVFFGNADAAILDSHQDVFRVFAQADLYVAALRAELDRIVHQRHERTLKGFGIAPDRG